MAVSPRAVSPRAVSPRIHGPWSSAPRVPTPRTPLTPDPYRRGGGIPGYTGSPRLRCKSPREPQWKPPPTLPADGRWDVLPRSDVFSMPKGFKFAADVKRASRMVDKHNDAVMARMGEMSRTYAYTETAKERPHANWKRDHIVHYCGHIPHWHKDKLFDELPGPWLGKDVSYRPSKLYSTVLQPP